jgi:hypothetical protein
MEHAVAMEGHGAIRAGEDPAARSFSDRLSSALTGIFAAEIPSQEKQRLSTLAVHRFMSNDADEQASTKQVASMQLLERALVEVAKLAGVDRCNISQAKSFLRDHGAAHVASRLSRLSKVRNGNAHPDVSLLSDISSVSMIGAEPSTLQSTVHSDDDSQAADMVPDSLGCWFADGLSYANSGSDKAPLAEPPDRWDTSYYPRSDTSWNEISSVLVHFSAEPCEARVNGIGLEKIIKTDPVVGEAATALNAQAGPGDRSCMCEDTCTCSALAGVEVFACAGGDAGNTDVTITAATKTSIWADVVESDSERFDMPPIKHKSRKCAAQRRVERRERNKSTHVAVGQATKVPDKDDGPLFDGQLSDEDRQKTRLLFEDGLNKMMSKGLIDQDFVAVILKTAELPECNILELFHQSNADGFSARC